MRISFGSQPEGSLAERLRDNIDDTLGSRPTTERRPSSTAVKSNNYYQDASPDQKRRGIYPRRVSQAR